MVATFMKLIFRWKCICKAIKNVFDKADIKIQMFPMLEIMSELNVNFNVKITA